MTTFIVTYDLAETPRYPNENGKVKSRLIEQLNPLHLPDGSTCKIHITQNSNNNNYQLPETTFLLEVNSNLISPTEIEKIIKNALTGLNYVMGRLYIAVIDTNGAFRTPYIDNRNEAYSQSLGYISQSLFGKQS